MKLNDFKYVNGLLGIISDQHKKIFAIIYPGAFKFYTYPSNGTINPSGY